MGKSMEQLIEDIEACKPLVELDTELCDPRSAVGRQSAKNGAIERTGIARAEYIKLVGTRSTYIVPVGEKDAQLEFASIAGSECNCIVVEADKMYRRLAKAVLATLGNSDRALTSNQESALNSEITEIENDLDIGFGNRAAFVPIASGHTFADTEDLVNSIRTWVRKNIGDSLNRKFIQHDVANAALEKKLIADVPVIVTKVTQDEVAAFESEPSLDRLEIYAARIPKGDVDADKVGRVIAAVAKAKSKREA